MSSTLLWGYVPEEMLQLSIILTFSFYFFQVLTWKSGTKKVILDSMKKLIFWYTWYQCKLYRNKKLSSFEFRSKFTTLMPNIYDGNVHENTANTVNYFWVILKGMILASNNYWMPPFATIIVSRVTYLKW